MLQNGPLEGSPATAPPPHHPPGGHHARGLRGASEPAYIDSGLVGPQLYDPQEALGQSNVWTSRDFMPPFSAFGDTELYQAVTQDCQWLQANSLLQGTAAAADASSPTVQSYDSCYAAQVLVYLFLDIPPNLASSLSGINASVTVTYQPYEGCTRDAYIQFANTMNTVILVTAIVIVSAVVCIISPCLVKMLILAPVSAISQASV